MFKLRVQIHTRNKQTIYTTYFNIFIFFFYTIQFIIKLILFIFSLTTYIIHYGDLVPWYESDNLRPHAYRLADCTNACGS